MLLEALELSNVDYDDGKVTLTYLDREAMEIREVNFNKKKYDETRNTYVDDAETATKVEERVQRLLGVPFDDIGQLLGETRDVYAYDNFNSLEPVEIVEKFKEEDEGQIYTAKITDVQNDNVGIHIKFQVKDVEEHEGKTFQANMNSAKYDQNLKQWFSNPQKRKSQEERFKKKFHVDIADGEKLVGESIMVEVRNFNGNMWADIKNLPKPKK